MEKGKRWTDITNIMEFFGYKVTKDNIDSIDFTLYWIMIGLDTMLENEEITIKIKKCDSNKIMIVSSYGLITNYTDTKLERK